MNYCCETKGHFHADLARPGKGTTGVEKSLSDMQAMCTRRSAARSAPRMMRSLALRHVVAASPLLFATMSSAANAAAPTLHTFQGTSIDASKLSMSAFAGKPVLMVNVASR